MDDLFQKLAAPFPPEKISWRVGPSNKKKRQRELKDQNAKATKGQALAYIDARDVMERLDEVCGPGGWQNDYPHANGKTVCRIGIKVGDEWVWKADGAGDTDMEAEKGALSDSFKRAAVRWAIGRYLYDIETPWVDLDDREQIPKTELGRLRSFLPGGDPTPRQTPEPQARVRQSLVVTSALTGITSAETRAELAHWKATNDKMLSDMEAGGDYDTILRAYKTRWNALNPVADDPFRPGPDASVSGGDLQGAGAH
jgi:hypothetical protein